MLEIAQDFERTAATLEPLVLIGPGLAAVLIGLFIWLGGLGLRKLLVAIVGAVGGGICGFFLSGQNTAAAAISAAVGAALAVIFEKAFMIVLAAALVGVFGFAFLAILFRTVDTAGGVEQARIQIPMYSWMMVGAVVVAVILAGVYLWRFTSALCCAALGTLLVSAGMILLLLYKGTTPVSSICDRPSLYAAVFAGMTAFGTIEQLLLCPSHHKRRSAKKGAHKDKEEPEQTRNRWRT